MSQSSWTAGAAPQQPGYGQQAAQPQQQQPGYPHQGQPQQGYGQPPPAFAQAAAALPDAAAARGFLGGIIDFSFKSYIAPKLIKVVYALWIVAVVLGMLAGAYNTIDLAFFRSSFHLDALVQLFVLPLAGAGAVVLGRLYCEMLIVLFRIAENLTDMNRKMKE
jgi:uncharacterized membrane protein YciS (DUF1049 family)